MNAQLRRLQHTIAGGAMIIGVASVCSRVLGLLRDRLLSSMIGTGPVLDSYFAAFKIPDFVFNILVLGVMSASFVPVFLEYEQRKGKGEAMRIANSVLNILLVLLAGVAMICAVFAPQLVGLLAYGDTPEQQVMIVYFTRFMLVSLVLFGVSNVLSGILHAHRQFFIYALAPILYNVGIIIGILIFVPLVGPLGLPLGVVLGALLHVLGQIPAVVRIGFHYQPIIDLRHRGVQAILKLMPPRALALGLVQVNLLIIFALASTLGDRTRSWWQFADNLQHFPINIVGVSLALAAFPAFSEAFAEQNSERFKQVFSENFRRILFFIIPVSIGTLLLRAQIVRLVYGAGKFGWTDTVMTAQLLGVFALSMFAQAVIPLLTRAFFAKQDTRTPVVMSVLSVACNVGFSFVFIDRFGILGLGLAFSISMIFQMLALITTLRIRHGDLDDDRIILSTVQVMIASVVMGIVIQGMKYFIEAFVRMDTFVGVFTQTAVAASCGALIYLYLATRFHFHETRAIWAKLLWIRDAIKRVL